MTPDDIDPADEAAWSALPEALRLALLDLARREAGVGDRPLTVREVAAVAAIPAATVHHRCRLALLRLRRRAEERCL